MPKISFNAQALGIASHEVCPDMRSALTQRTAKPIMVFRPGIDAIIEGLSLANVEGFEVPRDQLPTDDIDP